MTLLDDKVDLMQRQNKTLEQLAETLFRQWFVEEASEDWEVKSLIEVADYLNGLALQKYSSNGIDFLPVIKIRELKRAFQKIRINVVNLFLLNTLFMKEMFYFHGVVV
ncbi:MAG: hypothetical protein WKG06_42585 [Segetibacter sp.]